MNEKTDIKEYIWVIPLVAGFLAIIAILVPTANFNISIMTWDWWMWNFTSMRAGYDSISVFISDMDFIRLSTITTSAVLLSAVNLLILSIRTKNRNLNTKYFELTSIISAVLSIGIMIYYINAIDLAFFDGFTMAGMAFPSGIHFWEMFKPDFGIFLPFISATLSFIGTGVFRYYSTRKEDIVPLKMDTSKEHIPVSKTMGSLNYCPECGHKILQADTIFCTECGFKF